MEKTAASASEAAAVAAKAVASASEEAAVASVASASEEAAVTSKTVPASDVAAGALAAGSRSKTPLGWDPYEKDKYIRPMNPFDTSLEDPWAEESGSDVGSDVESVDVESVDTKTRQVLRRLQSGQYDYHFANGVFRCPFCTRRLGATDFNCVVRHAECISSCNPKVGESVNVNSHFAKHKALGLHLRELQEVAIAEGRMPPKRSAPGSIRWHKRQRRDVAQMEAEARRRG